MDPDANLKEQLEIVRRTMRAVKEDDALVSSEAVVDLVRMCELVAALNRWIESGGAPPARWLR